MAYNRIKDTVKVINDAITLNRMNIAKSLTLTSDQGAESHVAILAEDLSNLVDVGTQIANLDADMLKSFAKDVAMGIAKTEFIDRAYTAETFGIAKSSEEYNGAYQRLCIKNIQPLLESHAQRLVNGVNYFDGKYYGPELDGKVFKDSQMFKIPYSIGYEDIRAKFVDAKWLTTTIEEWRNAIKTSLEVKLKGMSDDLINMAIVNAYNGNRRIQLITKFNEFMGYTDDNEKTWEDIKQSETLAKEFSAFQSMAIKLVVGGLKKLNKKYNDGTVPTFTPKEKINLIGLTEYISTIDGLGYANIYHNELLPKENIYEVTSWQTDGDDMLPLMTGTTAKIKNGVINYGTVEGVNKGLPKSESVTDNLDKVVMFLYDSDMMGVTSHMDKVGVEEIGAELYTTYFHHMSLTQYLDERNASVVFTLD